MIFQNFFCALVIAFVLCSQTIDAKLKGQENWKQRSRNWKDSIDGDLQPKGTLVGIDDAVSAKQYQEEKNSVWDSPSEEDSWNEREVQKQHRNEDEGPKSDVFEPKPVSDLTAWHEKKMKKFEERRLKEARYNQQQQQKRRQPREYRLEQYTRDQQNQSNPPPHDKVAEMARYIVHHSDWAALAYTSRQPGTAGRPMADILSISDGSGSNSTGIPYMYVTPKDIGIQDLAKDSHCSLAMTLAQGDYCRKESLDPEDPRCAHVFLNGKVKTLKNGTEEWTSARKYFFDRHPHLQNMPADHKFRFVKLKISQVIVQDYFGGPAYPTLTEYFAAKPEDLKTFQSPSREEAAELLPGAVSDMMPSIPIQ